MKPDIQIAQEAQIKPIAEIAAKIGVTDFTPYGHYKAKVDYGFGEKPPGKVVLVTAISPTPAGEGKTTTTVGLGDALARLGENSVICLREPSLGPVFGVKGGAAGGGYAQVIPMEDINLHFTGDIHAISSAHNLLAAMLDNHIQQGNPLRIDTRRVVFRRTMDMNDRQLRNIVGGLGGKPNGTPREDGFDITAASEVMAVFCLSESISELKANLAKIVVAYNFDGAPVTAGDLNAAGAMAALLKEAFNPNLVQTLEGTPAVIHGGPFANIAHGCNTAVATRLAMRLGDIVVTEAGFGADLGAEKFLNIKCRRTGIAPSAVVLVATVRALKFHGGIAKDELASENLSALNAGFPNLQRHIENITKKFGLPCVVAINRFPTDSAHELEFLKTALEKINVPVALSEVFGKGGKGGEDLARAVLTAIKTPSELKFTYRLDAPLAEKIETIAKEIYNAGKVTFSSEAALELRRLEKLGYGNLPVCMAKTQYSFSDDPKKIGAPKDFELTVKKVRLSAGAGFVVALTGDIMTMPGLPKIPSAEKIDVDSSGTISGLF